MNTWKIIIHWTYGKSNWVEEHERGADYRKAEKSAVAKHAENWGHEIQLDKVKILHKEVHFGKRIYREAIKI